MFSDRMFFSIRSGLWRSSTLSIVMFLCLPTDLTPSAVKVNCFLSVRKWIVSSPRWCELLITWDGMWLNLDQYDSIFLCSMIYSFFSWARPSGVHEHNKRFTVLWLDRCSKTWWRPLMWMTVGPSLWRNGWKEAWTTCLYLSSLDWR